VKYRPKIDSINDLQDGDEFLVGESRWVWLVALDGAACFTGTGLTLEGDRCVAERFIRSKVPIERDIPCPEGYELKMGDGKWKIPEGAQIWCQGRWENWEPNAFAASSNIHIYAIPIKPREFEGEVFGAMPSVIYIKGELPIGTRVRVTVLEEGE
jgi:hypothetical protein